MFTIRPNIPQTPLAFKGFYKPDITIIATSDEETVDRFLRETEEIRKPNFAEEGDFLSFISQRIKGLKNVLSDPEVKRNAKEVRKKLDLIA